MPHQTQSQIRRAENEVVFQQHNNRIMHQADNLLPSESKATYPIGFTCECSNEKCLDTVEMSVEQYHRSTNDKKRFIIKPGHEQLDIEAIVDQSDNFTIVEKFETPPKTNGVLNETDSSS